MAEISGVTKKVMFSGVIGLIILFFLNSLVASSFPATSDFMNQGRLLIATAFATFVSGILVVYLTFDEIPNSRAAINVSFYSGCITAMPLIAVCVLTALMPGSPLPACLLGTLGAVLMSVIGGCIAFEILSRLKSWKTRSN